MGQLIRYVTKNKVLLYPEEQPDFQCPSCYQTNAGSESKTVSTPLSPAESPAGESEKAALPKKDSAEPLPQDEAPAHRPESIEKVSSPATPATEKDFDLTQIATTGLSRVDTRVTIEKIHTRRDLEQAYTTATLEKGPTRPIIPETLDDGTILVDWYNTDDPENPQNWSLRKKNFVTFQIW